MKSRKPQRAALGDVAVVKFFDNEYLGQPYEGDLYVVGIVEAIHVSGEVLRVFTGAGYIERSSPRVREIWTESATAFKIDRLVDRLKRNHPGGFMRLNELRFFLDEYRIDQLPKPRRRPPAPPPEARSRWIELGVVSIDTARRLKDLRRSSRRIWCRHDGRWQLLLRRRACEETLPAYDALDLSDWLPADVEGDDGSSVELLLTKHIADDGSHLFRAEYPGIWSEQGKTVADACGRLLVWLIDLKIVSRESLK